MQKRGQSQASEVENLNYIGSLSESAPSASELSSYGLHMFASQILTTGRERIRNIRFQRCMLPCNFGNRYFHFQDLDFSCKTIPSFSHLTTSFYKSFISYSISLRWKCLDGLTEEESFKWGSHYLKESSRFSSLFLHSCIPILWLLNLTCDASGMSI